jgi:hypothetical protein
MRTRKHRRHSEAQRKETPFFSTRRDKANAEGNLGDGFFQPKLIMGKSGVSVRWSASRRCWPEDEMVADAGVSLGVFAAGFPDVRKHVGSVS